MAISLNNFKSKIINSPFLVGIISAAAAPLRPILRHQKFYRSPILKTGTVTVVIPNYNYAKYLKKRIKSILNQTYPISELIILDDASTDDSTEVIDHEMSEIKKTYPNLKIQFVKNSKNSGKAIFQWQKAFQLATSDFIWIAETDDLSSRHFLAEVMRGFEDPEVVISYANSAAIDGRGATIANDFANRSVDKTKSGHWKHDYINDGQDEIEKYFAINCTIPNVSAVVFRNNQKIPYHKYLEAAAKFSQSGDWYFYLQILTHGKIAYKREALNFFRIHSDSTTAKSKKSLTHLEEIKTIHSEILKNYTISPNIRKAMLSEEARIAARYDIINQ